MKIFFITAVFLVSATLSAQRGIPSSSITAPISQIDQLGEQAAQTAVQTAATEASAETEFQKTCITFTDTDVECNTKTVLAGVTSTMTQDKVCKSIKCDASSSSMSAAETQCETQSCVPLMTLKETAQTCMEGTCTNPYTAAICKICTQQFTDYQAQETQCRSDCKNCQSRDINTSDDYNNKSVCGGTYGTSYDTAIKSAKANGLKKQKACIKYCKGKSKLNWAKILGITAVAGALATLATDTQDTGSSDSTTTNTPGPYGDCSLKTNEKERTICYCKEVPGYDYVDGKGCIPTGLGASPLTGNGGGSKPGSFGSDPNKLGSTTEDSNSGYGSSDTDMAASTSTGGTGSAGSLGGSSGSGADSGKKKDQKGQGYGSSDSGRSPSEQGGYGAQQGAYGSGGSGSMNDSASADMGSAKEVTDILKKDASLFETISEKLNEKYKGGTFGG